MTELRHPLCLLKMLYRSLRLGVSQEFMLENVRPGKHQHPTCSQAALQRPAAVAQPLTDEALLRQALEALLGQRGEPDWHTGKQRENAIAALRERLAAALQPQPKREQTS